MEPEIRITIDGVTDPEALRSATEHARQAAVLELYRLGRITSGAAGRLLALSRGEFLELAGRNRIATVQVTPDELRDELQSASR